MHRIAFLDATLLELLVNALDAPDILEAAQSLIIQEVGHGHQLLQCLAGNHEITGNITLDGNLLRIPEHHRKYGISYDS